MSEGLPKGWAETVVREIVEDFQTGFACGEKNVQGGTRHLRMNNIGTEGKLVLDLVRTVPENLARQHHYLRPGDVLLCTTNSSKLVGKCAVFDLPGRYVFSNHLTRLRPEIALVDSYFLLWSLWVHWQGGTFEDKCKHWVNQSTLPKEELLEIDVALPPINEQHRIVAKLKEVLSKVDASQQRLAKIPIILKRFRQSVLASACSGRLTADWREENVKVEPAESLLSRIREWRLRSVQSKKEQAQVLRAFDKQNLQPTNDEFDGSDLPSTWTVCRIGSIGAVCNGSTPSRKESSFWGGGIPWVSSGEVRNNIISSTRECITDAGYESCSVQLLPQGTVLLAMIGEGKTRGQTAILKIEASINQNIAAVILDHGLIYPEYLWRWFQFQYESTREHGSGSGPPALNCDRVRELPLILPPYKEQQEISRRVEGFFALADQIETRYAKAKASVDQLTQSILAKAFRGELVPQDPNDEPASALLERIKAEWKERNFGSKRRR